MRPSAWGVYFHILHHPRYSVTVLHEDRVYSALPQETRDEIQSENSVRDGISRPFQDLGLMNLHEQEYEG